MSRFVAMSFAAVVIVATTPLVRADVTRYEWAPVTDADHYAGTMSQDGASHRFRTDGTWLLFDEGSAVTLDAVDAYGRVLQPIPLQNKTQKRVDAPLPAPETLPLPDEQPLVEEPAPEPDLDAESEPTPDETDAPTPDIAEDDLRRQANGYVTLQLGIGKEWLDAESGVSEYDGHSNIGGTIVSGAFATAKSPWSFPWQVAAHNFSAKVSESEAGVSTESRDKFLRLGIRGGVDLDVLHDGGPAAHGFTVGIGLGYFRLPLLALDPDRTGTADLENNAAFGPYAGVGYTRFFDAENVAGVTVSTLPLSFKDGVKAMSTNALLYWRHAVAARLYIELGCTHESSTLGKKVDCPNVTGCESTSESSDRMIQGRLGVGGRF